MRFMTIASGSSGNCTFVGSNTTSILIDAGISKKRIEEGLKTADINFNDISGIFVTHEHVDHIRALGVISRSYSIPIYATYDTCQFIKDCKEMGSFDTELLKSIEVDKKLSIGDIDIEAHTIWHDAQDPVCYTIEIEGKKLSIATDLGDYDDYIVSTLKDSDILHIEANHDIRMLQVGPYPYHLKQRILGKRGHLSNERGGQLIRELLNNHIRHISLGHLSKENNYPELAYETVKLELADNEFTKDVRDFNLNVAPRDIPGEMILL